MALVGTLALGLWLRWALTGRVTIRGDFGDLRHAHSHLGYYGVLFPLAWAAWSRVGAPIPTPRLLVVYGAAICVAVFGFLRAGYGPEAIAGSTVVGAIWLLSAWPLRTRWRDLFDPLGVIPFGIVGALACIPPIAMNLRTAPEIAEGYVATFLSGLLLAVIVPSVLATTRAARTPWPVLAAGAVAGAIALGVSASPLARAGLLLYTILLARFAWSGELPTHSRLTWGAVAAGLAAIALGVIPNTRPVAIGAIHFLILGPVLETLLPPSFRARIPTPGWWLYHGSVSLLAAPLVLQGLGAGGWTLYASAAGGSAVVLWWLVVGGRTEWVG